jgi:hypothetical protein
MENTGEKTMTEQTLAELTFEYKNIKFPVEISETERGNKYVAVDYKVWNRVTANYTVEQHAEIKEALDKWFEYEQIFVDRYHKDGLKNQYAPIYWLLNDNDDE